MRKRVLILPLAAIVIVALCVYRISTIDPNAPRPLPPTGNLQPLTEQEMFELSDANNELVRLKTYLGRHQILIVFFDDKAGADHDPIVERLRKDFDQVTEKDIKVFAVSSAIPQENRKVAERSGDFPFPMLSDPDRRVHNAWGVGEGTAAQPTSKLFFINRAGQVDRGTLTPHAVDDPQAFIDRLIGS